MAADKKHQIVPVRKVVNTSGQESPPQLVPWTKELKFEPIDDCKLCNSKFREEAEDLYDRTGNVKRVHTLLTQDRMMDISYGAVRNHLKFHYEAHSANHLVQEHANEVADWLDLQFDSIGAIKRGMAIIEREMRIIAAHSEGMPLPERRKNAETVGKLHLILKDSHKTIDELNRARKGVTLVFNQLKVILQDEMKSLPSEDARKVVQNVFAKLKDSVGHLDLEDEE